MSQTCEESDSMPIKGEVIELSLDGTEEVKQCANLIKRRKEDDSVLNPTTQGFKPLEIKELQVLQQTRRVREKLAKIDLSLPSVKIGLSTMTSGVGLFAVRDFLKNDIITEYCGDLVVNQLAVLFLKRRDTHSWLRLDGENTYLKKHANYDFPVIDGLWKVLQIDSMQCGAGQISVAGAKNAKFQVIRTNLTERLFVVATRDIPVNEEIFLDT